MTKNIIHIMNKQEIYPFDCEVKRKFFETFFMMGLNFYIHLIFDRMKNASAHSIKN